ncbi:MAG: indoleacetamide hydrolase [Pseudomonadota bacterium]
MTKSKSARASAPRALTLFAGAALAACASLSAGDAPVSIEQRTRAYLSAIEAKADLNAYVYVDEEGAIARAQALDAEAGGDLPLRGTVLAVKDNVHVAGMPNAAGTAALRGFTPSSSAAIIDALEEAGAIIIGKAGMHELAYGITSNNAEFGAIKNPVDPTRIPGGSSGGSAAAVAAGLCDAAIGTDTGGSVRLPAALTGVSGFRPTTGRYSQDGMTLISPTRDTAGFIAPTVADIVPLDAVAAGGGGDVKPAAIEGLRLGVPRAHFYENLDPDVAAASEALLTRLESLGAILVEADLAGVPELNEKVGFPIVLYETSVVLPDYLEANDTGVSADALAAAIKSPDVRPIVEAALGGAISKDAYEQALEIDRPKLQAVYADYFEIQNVEAVIFPTTPLTARPIDGIEDGVMVGGERRETFAAYIQNTDPGSNAGIPGLSLPIAVSSEGLPIGIELDAAEGDDKRLLSIGLAIEQALAADPLAP